MAGVVNASSSDCAAAAAELLTPARSVPVPAALKVVEGDHNQMWSARPDLLVATRTSVGLALLSHHRLHAGTFHASPLGRDAEWTFRR